MNRWKRTAVIGFLFLSFGLPEAQGDELDTFLDMSFSDLLNVPVVTASKRLQTLMEAPSAISIITRDEILQSPANTIPELLQYVVGMDGYTKTHTDQDVAARGLAYDETPKMLILVDNQPINIVVYGGVQWPTLPLAKYDIDRIEIVRGPSSALYGADAQVGVVNIITLAASERKNSASVVYGERGTQGYEIGLAHKLGEGLAVAVRGGFVRTEKKGDAETAEAVLAAPNYGIKDWADIYSLTYRLDYERGDAKFSSEGGVSSDEEGYNPSSGDRSIDLSEKRTVYVNNQAKIPVGKDEVGIRIGFRDLWQENQRWDNGSYVFKYELKKSRGIDADVQYTLHTLANHDIIFGGSASRFLGSRDIANTPPYIYDEVDNLLSVYAQDQVAFANRRVLLTLSGRYDKWSSFDGEFTPRATLNVDLYKQKANLRLMAGTSFRRPSFDESYYFVRFPGGWLKGSQVSATAEDGSLVSGVVPNLEKLKAYEAGLRIHPNERTYIDIEAFRNTIKDNLGVVVYYAAVDELNLLVANIGDRLTLSGAEIEVKHDLSNGARAFLNYTYQRGVIKKTSAPEEKWLGAPRNKLSGGISYSGLATADVRFRYVGKVTYPEVDFDPVDDYWTVDFALSKQVGEHAHVKLSVINALDRARYEYPIYTQIKRKLSLNLRYQF
ncbi:MAG: outer membrane receptor protein involved in Fe transport [Candidatus Latescibacterota bacterium]|jgi:outer membrane receptor protein involved in Fe transport